MIFLFATLCLTVLLAAAGFAVSMISIALWMHRLRPLKDWLTARPRYRDLRWTGSDTGFLVFSELLAEAPGRMFSAAFVLALALLPFDPLKASMAVHLVSAIFCAHSTTLCVWNHLQACRMHRAPEDDSSGVFGLAEKDWRARRNRNAEMAAYSLALALVLAVVAYT